MADYIYQVDPETRNLVKIEPVSFASIGIKERADLQEWIIGNPELLGEQLLVITSEYSGFDASNRRVDILALDKNGMLVVIELKLDAKGSLAELQAIRYAAFFSTMTIDDAVRMLADWDDSSSEDASTKICEFLESEELPELNNRPRIILAAGSMDDQELTSSVLWLRGFNLDITCTELAPYRMPDSHQVTLVPRTIIPIPEARDFLVGIERKEVAQVQHIKNKTQYAALWRTISEEFNQLRTPLTASGRSSKSFMRLSIRHPYIHYEWVARKRDARLDVALHFESKDQQENYEGIKAIKNKEASIREGIDLEFDAGPWGRKWAEARFRLPLHRGQPDPAIAHDAASVMKTLIDRTYPILQTEVLGDHQ
jgi:hypothetical protein